MSVIRFEITFYCVADALVKNQISDRLSHDIPPQMKILNHYSLNGWIVTEFA